MAYSPTPAELDHIAAVLRYDEDSGELIWVRPARRVQPGDLAGTWVERDKRLVVGVAGRSYPGTSLAWFLAYDQWPSAPVRLRPDPHRDRAAMPLADMYLATEKPPSWRKSAVYMRNYREKKRRLAARAAASPVYSLVPGVKWRPVTRLWECTAPGNINAIYASFEQKVDAERYQTQLADTLAWLRDHPPDVRPGDENILALDAGSRLTDEQREHILDLASARQLYANGPHGLVTRARPFVGAPVGEHRKGLTTRRLMLNYRSRLYPAASVAWFIAHGEWPRRKALVLKDANPENLRLSNLRLRDDAL